MNRTTHRLYWVLGLFSSLLSSDVRAQWINLNGQQGTTQTTSAVEILKSDSSSTVIRFRLQGFEANPLIIENKSYVTLSVPGLSPLRSAGDPELPKWSQNIMIPFSTAPAVKILEARTEFFSLGPIAPSKGDLLRNQNPADVAYSFSAAYNQDQFFPSQVAKISPSFQMRDTRGVTLSILPFQYNARTGQLKVTHDLVIEIETAGHRSHLYARRGALDSSFLKLYQNSFLNFSNLGIPERSQYLIEDTGRLLIVYHPSFEQGLSQFVEWKQQKGLQVQLASLTKTGKTALEIKNFIAEQYRKNKISMVILVGDAEFVPFFPGTAGNAKGAEADPLYGVLEGADSYPEVIISRFSTKTLQGLETIVSKIVQYEKSPDLDGGWYSKAVGIASDEGEPTDWERANLLRDPLLDAHYESVDQLYDPGVKPKDVAKALNEGRGFINYIGHGSETQWVTSRFSTSDIDALQNGSKLPFIVSVACVNGKFAGYRESFAERWLLAGTPEEPKGAVAIFASSTNQSWVPPTVGQAEITKLLTTEKMDTIGMLFVHGSIAVLADNSSSADQTFQTWHIFGDPSMQVRTRTPSAISAPIPDTLELKNHRLELEGIDPRVTLGVSQNGQRLGSGISDANGTVVVQLNTAALSNDEVLLTFTGFNKIPEMRWVRLRSTGSGL